jgi:hypothetical protein
MTALVITALVHLSFSMRGDRARGWPVKTKVTLVSAAAAKELTIEAADARKPVSVEVPEGTYKLTIAAEHHRVYSRMLELDKDLSLPEIPLAAIPAISGRVVAREKEIEIPLAGAQVMDGPKQLATTNEQGLFRVELSDPRTPDSITIVHTGQAPATVPLFENLAAENELGTITLPRGATLTVILDRRYRERKMLMVSVVGKTSASREVKPNETEASFSGIPPGDVQVVVKGTEPLEAMNEKVEMRTDDQDHTMVIAPFSLDGRVMLGNDSLRGGGTIEIASAGWRAPVTIDDEGRFGGTMWQTGKVTGWLKTPFSPIPIMEGSPELGSDPSSWTIMLKRRFIEGHVFDAATKEPVIKGRIEVTVTAGERRSESTVDVAKDGRFSIPAMQNGRYDLRASADAHADQRKTWTLGQNDESKTVDFALEGGVEAEIWCVGADGQPAQRAQVFVDDGRVIVADAKGKAVLRLHSGETRTVYVMAWNGSFATTDLRATRSGDFSLQVIVPRPAGSLRITNRQRTPVRISFAGRELPAALVQSLRGGSGDPDVLQLMRLPAGDYGIWSPGMRSQSLQLNAGEMAVELVPIMRRK